MLAAILQILNTTYKTDTNTVSTHLIRTRRLTDGAVY